MRGIQWPLGNPNADIQQKEESWEFWVYFVDDRRWDRRMIASQEEWQNSVNVWRMTEQKGMKCIIVVELRWWWWWWDNQYNLESRRVESLG